MEGERFPLPPAIQQRIALLRSQERVVPTTTGLADVAESCVRFLGNHQSNYDIGRVIAACDALRQAQHLFIDAMLLGRRNL